MLDERFRKLHRFPLQHRLLDGHDLIDRARPGFEDDIVVLAHHDTASLRESSSVVVAGISEGKRTPFRHFDEFVHGSAVMGTIC